MRCTKFGTKAIEELIQAMKQGTMGFVRQDIEIFDLSENRISSDSMTALVSLFDSMRIKKLYLSECGLTDDEAHLLSKALLLKKNANSLIELDLGGNAEMGPKALESLSKPWGEPKCHLVKVNLSNMRMDDLSVKVAGKCLGSNTSIESINLDSYNRVNQNVLAKFVEQLSANSTLTDLILPKGYDKKTFESL